jgi:hypothetical protein
VGIDVKDRRIIGNLYWNQKAEIQLDNPIKTKN